MLPADNRSIAVEEHDVVCEIRKRFIDIPSDQCGREAGGAGLRRCCGQCSAILSMVAGCRGQPHTEPKSPQRRSRPTAVSEEGTGMWLSCGSRRMWRSG